jgi:hypothetical protein
MVNWNIRVKELIAISFFWLFISSFGLILVFQAEFGIIDDHQFIGSIFSGENLEFYIIPETGRFYPLNAQEYNLVSYFNRGPEWFYAYNAIQLLIVAYLLVQIGQLALDKKNSFLSYGIVLILILSPGFISAWSRLHVPERNVLFLFSIFIYNYLLYKKNQRYENLILSILAASISLFYKETAFIFVGAIGAIGLYFDTLNKKDRVFYLILIILAIFWMLIYGIYYLNSNIMIRYGEIKISYIFSVPICFGFFMLSDPLSVISLMMITLSNIIKISKRKKIEFKIENILLIAALLYFLSFIVLKIYAYHYLLPISCVIPYVFIKYLHSRKIKYTEIKLFLFIISSIYITFTLPVAINILYANKQVPYNFSLMRNELKKITKNLNEDNEIKLVGINQNASNEILDSINKFFRYDTNLTFNINSEINNKNNGCMYFSDVLIGKCEDSSKYFKSGDVLILTPYDSVDVRAYLETSKDYSLIYQTDSSNLIIPSTKTLIKYLTFEFGKPIINYRITVRPYDQVNFFVYVKK